MVRVEDIILNDAQFKPAKGQTPHIVASFPMQDARREKEERRRAALLTSLKQEVRAVDSGG